MARRGGRACERGARRRVGRVPRAHEKKGKERRRARSRRALAPLASQRLLLPVFLSPLSSRGWRRRNAVIAAGLASLTASAQDILPSFNGGGGTQPAFLPNTGVYQAPPLEASGNPPLMHWGDLALRPKLDYRFLYGDGIPVSTNHNYTTAIQSFAPGMLLEFGRRTLLPRCGKC